MIESAHFHSYLDPRSTQSENDPVDKKGVLKMFIKCLYKYSFFVDELSAALDKIEEQKGQVVIQRSDDDIQKIADQVTHWTF